MGQNETVRMGRYRATMTDTDRDNIAGTDEPTQRETDQSVYRVRQRITNELPTDIGIMIEHRPDLFEEFWGVMCKCGLRGRSDKQLKPLLQRLSQALGEPIIVGDTIYEDGDQHPLSASESQPATTEETSDE